MITSRQFIVVLVTALLVCAASARAEVQKSLNPCGGQKLCASYALVLTPPDGWVVDAKATSENKVQIMVPKGQSFATAEPLIYVQVIYQPDKQQALADFARLSNARWLAANPRAKITELPAVERANGKSAFLRFAFENPGKAQQAYEVGALGVDSDRRQRFRSRRGDERQQQGGIGSRRRRLCRVPQGALSGCGALARRRAGCHLSR